MRKSDLIMSVVKIRRMSYGWIKLVYCMHYMGTYYRTILFQKCCLIIMVEHYITL